MWTSIDAARAEYALELLTRSKSAPLQIISATPQSTKLHEHVLEGIMREVGRMQTLEICLPSSEPPLPQLQNLHLSVCALTSARGGHASFYNAVKDFLEDRRRLGIPAKSTTISASYIAAGKTEELEEFTNITCQDMRGYLVDDSASDISADTVSKGH